MKSLILTPEQTNELRRAHRLTKNKRVADRIKAVYLLSRGKTAREIAEVKLLNAGLNLEDFCEYSHTNGAKQFRCMTVKENRTAVLPEKYPNLPLMFSLVLKKKT